MQTEQFRMVAKTLYGLEDVLAKELENLGALDIEIGRRMVAFNGDKKLLYKANFKLRTALRILKPINTFTASNPDELYTKMRKINWSEYLSCDKTFSIDTVIYSDNFTHSKYVGYKAKDAIVDYFRDIENKRPSVRLDNPDVLLNIHISQKTVTISLDSSGQSLHKRGYREVQTTAPINEVLAAGILLMAGWDGQCDFLDPMCGSGTFPIEAALIARNIAPGVYREGYAFQKWADYDEDLFDSIYNDESEEREFRHKIVGSDISSVAVEIASRNVARAGLKSCIEIEKISMRLRENPTQRTLIVTNPPYGERLKLSDAENLYSMIGERLKHNFPGCEAWIIAYKKEHFDYISLKPKQKVNLMNGSLPCELRGYELFDGKHDEFKKKKVESSSQYKDRKPKRSKDERDFTPRRVERKDDRNPRGGNENNSRNRNRRDSDRSEQKEYSRKSKDKRQPSVHPARFKKSKDERESSKTDYKQRKSKEKIDSFNNSRDSRSWPSDRFRARENRQHFNRRLQVYKADDITNKED